MPEVTYRPEIITRQRMSWVMPDDQTQARAWFAELQRRTVLTPLRLWSVRHAMRDSRVILIFQRGLSGVILDVSWDLVSNWCSHD